jgi:histidinol-phosphate aminotransferase
MSSVDQLLREDLRGRVPYGAPQLDVPVRLNTNENPHPPSAALVRDVAARVAEAARAMNRYPDRDAAPLRAALGAYLTRSTGHELDVTRVWAANGSNEIFQQLLQAFGGPGRTALGFEPTYTMHRLICSVTGTSYLPIPPMGRFQLDPAAAAAVVREHAPDVLLLCSPNNPTGTALELETIETLYDAAQAVRPSLVIVDEAYAEFSQQRSAVHLLPGRERLVVTRTMSKAFAFAAARLGYLAAAPAVVDALQLVRLPYHLSVLSQAAALAALEHADELLATVEAVKKERDRMVVALTDLGLQVVDSDANFLLFGEFADAGATWQGLLDRGVLVRDVGIPGWLRVSAGTQEETDAFLHAMRVGLEQAVAVDMKEVDL